MVAQQDMDQPAYFKSRSGQQHLKSLLTTRDRELFYLRSVQK